MAVSCGPPWEMPPETYVSSFLKTSLIYDELVLLDVDLCAGCFVCVCHPQVPQEDMEESAGILLLDTSSLLLVP